MTGNQTISRHVHTYYLYEKSYNSNGHHFYKRPQQHEPLLCLTCSISLTCGKHLNDSIISLRGWFGPIKLA